ncbi:hypothetical protein BDE02_12G063000 [Populus trichocarpa]|nr:hypothetical protein BDE02_12G063000 [Populus trichocarpa]
MILETTNHEEQLGATQESFVQGYMTPSYSFVPAVRIICLPSMWIQNGRSLGSTHSIQWVCYSFKSGLKELEIWELLEHRLQLTRQHSKVRVVVEWEMLVTRIC